jgi:hypothetical protein
MPITINTYCRINRNGSININTDPTFPGPPPQFICVSGANIPEVNGTYTFVQYFTQNGFTRPEYYFNQFSISVLYTIDGRYGLLDGSGDDTLLYEGLTFPPPLNPYLETSWTDPNIVITQGPC